MTNSFIILRYYYILKLFNLIVVSWVVSWLRRLVAGLSPWRPGFMPGTVHMGFMVGKVTLGQVFRQFLRFFPVSIIPPWFYILKYHLGITIGPLVDAVQRHTLIPLTRTWTSPYLQFSAIWPAFSVPSVTNFMRVTVLRATHVVVDLTDIITDYLTPCSRVIFEKLIIKSDSQGILRFYWNVHRHVHKFSHRSLSRTRWIQSKRQNPFP
jgi:hypothetical protein